MTLGPVVWALILILARSEHCIRRGPTTWTSSIPLIRRIAQNTRRPVYSHVPRRQLWKESAEVIENTLRGYYADAYLIFWKKPRMQRQSLVYSILTFPLAAGGRKGFLRFSTLPSPHPRLLTGLACLWHIAPELRCSSCIASLLFLHLRALHLIEWALISGG